MPPCMQSVCNPPLAIAKGYGYGYSSYWMASHVQVLEVFAPNVSAAALGSVAVRIAEGVGRHLYKL